MGAMAQLQNYAGRAGYFCLLLIVPVLCLLVIAQSSMAIQYANDPSSIANCSTASIFAIKTFGVATTKTTDEEIQAWQLKNPESLVAAATENDTKNRVVNTAAVMLILGIAGLVSSITFTVVSGKIVPAMLAKVDFWNKVFAGSPLVKP